MCAAPPVADEGGGDAGFIFADTFEDALALLGRGSAVGFGGAAEDDDGVEVGGGVVVVEDGEVVDDDDGGVDEGREDSDEEDEFEKLHGNRVAGERCLGDGLLDESTDAGNGRQNVVGQRVAQFEVLGIVVAEPDLAAGVLPGEGLEGDQLRRGVGRS